jgi:4-carboxymuconolactone decarboxylase
MSTDERSETGKGEIGLLDPAERSARGLQTQQRLLNASAPEPGTLYEETWRDFIFAEVWGRDGLDLRSRYLIAMASAACSMDAESITSYARGALANGQVTLAELREAVLQLAVYGGFSKGRVFDAGVTAAADALGLPSAKCPALREAPWDPEVRHAEGRDNFNSVMVSGAPPAVTAYFEAGILNFVFGEMWMRPGLDQRSRRWITLVGVAESSSAVPIRSHTWAAMASGNASKDEMFEFVLQYAIHGGWPKASVIQGTVFEMAAKVEKGLNWDAPTEAS